jgi:hypothetical protein
MSRVRRGAAAIVTAAVLLPAAALGAGLTSSSKTLTVYRSCALTAYPTTTATTIDSYVNQASGNTNSGTATTLSVQSGTSLAKNRRAFIKFDLTKCSPAIPSTASVKQAYLRLYVTAVPTACRSLDIFSATASWTETGITWNNQPAVSATRTDVIQVGAAPCTNSTANAYVNGWNVTVDVAAFVAGTSTNNGWMMRDDAEGSTITYTATFSSKDLGTLAQSPQLIVTYTT